MPDVSRPEPPPDRHFRRVVDLASDAVVSVAADGTVVYANPAVRDVFGWPPEELVGRPIDVLMPEPEATAHRERMRRYLETGQRTVDWSAFRISALRRDGTVFPLELRFTHHDEGGRDLFTAFARDLRPGLEREARMQETAVELEESLARAESAEARYRALFDGVPYPMFAYDPETLRFLAANDAAVREYGWSREEFLWMDMRRIRPEEDVAAFERVARRVGGARPEEGPWRHVRRDGSIIEVEIHSDDIVFGGRPARLALAIDVGERRRIEERLRSAQRLESIGRLAGGVAHDFNNVLTVIAGHAEFLRDDFGYDPAASASLDEIADAVTRAGRLTGQLLAFGRRQIVHPEALDLHEIVASMETMLRRLLPENVRIETSRDDVPAHVVADRGQLEQVVLNLVVNAVDAMPDGGRVRVDTRTGDDGCVHLVVADTGTGIREDARAHLYEPFFTTKPAGRGTGLGLATVHGIVQQTGGRIDFETSSEGTTFTVRLPRAAAPRLVAPDSQT